MSDAMEVEAAETATAPAGATGGLAKKTPTSTPMDPLDSKPSSVVREGDFVILVFGDGRQIFAHCVKSWRGKAPPVKINKRSYPTANLIGLPYGTVLEVERTRLAPLPPTEDLIPHYPSAAATTTAQATDSDQARKDENNDTTFPPLEQERDNRHLLDDNTSQSLDAAALERLRNAGTDGSAIVDKVRVWLDFSLSLISNAVVRSALRVPASRLTPGPPFPIFLQSITAHCKFSHV